MLAVKILKTTKGEEILTRVIPITSQIYFRNQLFEIQKKVVMNITSITMMTLTLNKKVKR